MTDSNLTSTEMDSNMSPSKPKKVASLLPNGKLFIENGMNVLLIGKHGTGKTLTVREIAKEMGLKVKYYSCATLDPYTDLVGVPVPDRDSNGHRTLEYVRPKDIDDADMIFFDELNRAHPKVLNAVMEIIQFRTINGDPLPNLKVCWGAINPPEKGYEVESLDLALLDRFDYYFEIKPQVSAAYLTASTGLEAGVAKAFATWWNEHDKDAKKDNADNYLSPRRLTKMATFYSATGNTSLLAGQVPPGIKIEFNKLRDMIRKAEGKEEIVATEDNVGSSSPDEWMVEKRVLRGKIPELSKWLRANPRTLAAHEHVATQLTTGISGTKIVEDWAPVVASMNPAVADKLVTGFDYQKSRQIKIAWNDSDDAFKAANGEFQGILQRHGVI